MNALVVVDMQNDFINGALGTKEAEHIVPAVRARIERAQKNGDEIIFTRDTHAENYLSTQEGGKLPVPHCISGSAGWMISEALPQEHALVIDKPTFGSVELGRYLYDLKPEKITILGLCTDICVISNALLIKAFLPETPIIVDAACCAGVTPESHENALKAMKMCQIEVIGE